MEVQKLSWKGEGPLAPEKCHIFQLEYRTGRIILEMYVLDRGPCDLMAWHKSFVFENDCIHVSAQAITDFVCLHLACPYWTLLTFQAHSSLLLVEIYVVVAVVAARLVTEFVFICFLMVLDLLPSRPSPAHFTLHGISSKHVLSAGSAFCRNI